MVASKFKELAIAKYACKKDAAFTHTRIGDPKLSISGGSYTVSDQEYTAFMKEYFSHICIGSEKEYMTEKQLDNGCIAIDFDLHYEKTVTTRQHDESHLIDMLTKYLQETTDLLQIPSHTCIEVFVMHKPNVNVKESDKTKDGIHVIIGMSMKRQLQTLLRTKVLPWLQDNWSDLPLKNVFENVIDSGVVNGNCNWQMYGSGKPGNEVYKLTHHFIAEIDDDNYWTLDNQEVPAVLPFETFLKLSARYPNWPQFKMQDKILMELKAPEVLSPALQTMQPKSSSNDNIAIKIIKLLPKKYIENHTTWIQIGIILFNEGFSVDDWAEVCHNYREHDMTLEIHDRSLDACKQKWITFKPKPESQKLTAYTLWKWLKESNKDAYYALLHERNEFLDLIQQINHNDVAKYFYNMNTTSYLWNQHVGWYALGKNNIWKHTDKQEPSGLKRDIADTMQNVCKDFKISELNSYKNKSAKITDKDEQDKLLKCHKSKLQTLSFAYTKFGSKEFINGVISFLSSSYEYENLEELMDSNRHLFAFTNCVYDLKEGTTRQIQATDYISLTTGYDFVPQSNNEVRTQIDKLFFSYFENQSTKKYLLDVLSSFVYGGNKWEQFYCFTGTGGNGKGTINDLMKSSLGNYYISVDCSLFTKPQERKDAPIPALVEAQRSRIMISTEPESDDVLQAGIIKKISGNDNVEARTLMSKHIVKYVPHYKVILQFNNPPRFNKIDGGVQRRLRLINFPFNFVAKENMCEPYHREGDSKIKDEYCKSDAWRNEFILMLLERYATIKDNKDLLMPQEVKETTNDYVNDNNFLKEWLDEYYDITKNEEDRIKSSDLKNQYLVDMRYDKIDDRKFKSAMIFNNISIKKTTSGNFFIGLKRKDSKLSVS